ncbi:MAG: RidA family protein [Vampirovibrionales bacterium]|nr:RidA family protein [Vampirovibrionales bacterium]
MSTLEDLSNPARYPQTLAEWDAMLPPPPQPVGSYVPIVQAGALLYTSGVLPMRDGQLLSPGAVGSFTVTLEQGQEAARQCALNALSLVKAHLGSLSRVERVVKITGFVNSPAAFTDQPKVLNGASDLLVAVFGEAGRHARSAVGVAALPLNAPVEIELILAVRPE